MYIKNFFTFLYSENTNFLDISLIKRGSNYDNKRMIHANIETSVKKRSKETQGSKTYHTGSKTGPIHKENHTKH
uniref:Uncharacterized protein n=1 Tax=Noccaea caerulescens TaxID=107243 RepID=A0A1J3H4U4_NOCCA